MNNKERQTRFRQSLSNVCCLVLFDTVANLFSFFFLFSTVCHREFTHHYWRIGKRNVYLWRLWTCVGNFTVRFVYYDCPYRKCQEISARLPGYVLSARLARWKTHEIQERSRKKTKNAPRKVLSFTPVAALSSLVALLLQLNIACLLCGKCNGKGKMISSGPPSCRRHPVTGLWSVHKRNIFIPIIGRKF